MDDLDKIPTKANYPGFVHPLTPKWPLRVRSKNYVRRLLSAFALNEITLGGWKVIIKN